MYLPKQSSNSFSSFHSFTKVIGSCWYLLAIERQEQCWKKVCDLHADCEYHFFDCATLKTLGRGRDDWFISSNISSLCVPGSQFFQFGIYVDAITFDITSAEFFSKYFYCLWWGLRNLRYMLQIFIL